MLIDWFTVVAQIINFLALVWLLKRFLYGPILKAIDAREELIASRLRDAESKQREAAADRQSWQQKTEQIDAQRATLLQKAEQQAEEHRRTLMDEARREADQRRAEWRATLTKEAEEARRTLIDRGQNEVMAQARQVLRDLADEQVEERIVAAFVRRMKAVVASDPAQVDVLWASGKSLSVRSAFELSASQRELIEGAVRAAGYRGQPIAFTTDAALIAGIELRSDGHALSWNVADYLQALKDTLTTGVPVRSE